MNCDLQSQIGFLWIHWSQGQFIALSGLKYGRAGGLEVWDKRACGAPVRRSPLEWGLTGFAQQDAIQVCPVVVPSDGPHKLMLKPAYPRGKTIGGLS